MPEPMLDPQLVSILRCPVSGQKLRVGTVEEMAEIPAQQRENSEAILLREDGRAFYPVVNGIPMLLPEHRKTVEG